MHYILLIYSCTTVNEPDLRWAKLIERGVLNKYSITITKRVEHRRGKLREERFGGRAKGGGGVETAVKWDE